jgi:hypothetical protein
MKYRKTGGKRLQGLAGIATVLSLLGCGTDKGQPGPCTTDDCNPIDDEALARKLYGGCTGYYPFWSACEDLSCIDGAEEQQYYQITDEVLLGLLGGDAAYKDAHFKLNDVSISGNPGSRKFRVDYLVIDGWVRIRTYVEVRRLDPFDETSFREQLVSLGSGLRVKRKLLAPIPLAEAEQKLVSCGGTVTETSWCAISLSKENGSIHTGGMIATFDYENNDCGCMDLNLENGITTCEPCFCWVT